MIFNLLKSKNHFNKLSANIDNNLVTYKSFHRVRIKTGQGFYPGPLF